MISAAEGRGQSPLRAAKGPAALLGASLVLGACLSGCRGGSSPERPVVSIGGEAMGTEYAVKVVFEEGRRPAAAEVEEIRKIVAEALDAIDRAMSTYRPDSELSRLNAHGAGEPFRLSPETFEVLALSLRVSEETGGAFDPTVGPLVDLWGFGPEARRGAPDERALAEARERVGWRKLALSEADRTVVKSRADVACDLSAVAKGYAVDRVSEALAARGFRDHIVEVGGEVRASGLNARREPWRVAVEKPLGFVREIGRIVPLSDLSVATSGGYRNYFEEGGRTYVHIIDPRTGRPVEGALASASVFHRRCAVADAYATAMIVLGPLEGFRLAAELDLPALFIVKAPGGGFEGRTTPAFDGLFGPAGRGGRGPDRRRRWNRSHERTPHRRGARGARDGRARRGSPRGEGLLEEDLRA